jgi:NADH dehydrogenase
MRVGILGGTGFVGGYLVDALLTKGHRPVVLVRPGSEERVRWRERCTLIGGEVADEGAVRALVQGSDALIYNIGILRERPGRGITFEALHWRGAKRAMDLAVDAGGRRFLLMSANGVRADGTAYQRTKYQAEEYLRTTGLPFTIYRPSVIFGPPWGHMEIATQLHRDIIRPPLPAPLFYRGLLPSDSGAFRLAPIHAEEVAGAFVQGLEDPQAIGRTILLCGPEDLTWRELLRRIAAAAGQPRKLMIPVPAAPLGLAARLLERFPPFPITADQLRMLIEGNTCESGGGDVARGRSRFDVTNLAYLASAA